MTSSGGGSQSAAASPSLRPGACPIPERGGSCLGELTPGTYSTSTFTPAITYTVPDDGWANWEDLPGIFLLLPPGESLDGVDADTSDFIGVYRSIAAAAANCEEVPEPGVGKSAQDLAAWFTSQPGLEVSKPEPTNVGGLTGLVIEVSLMPDWTGTCPFAPAVPLVPLIIGTKTSVGVHHVMQASYATRLYLLDLQGDNIVIEVVDHAGRLGLDNYASVVASMQFRVP